MTTIPTLFVYFLYDHIPTFFYIFKKCTCHMYEYTAGGLLGAVDGNGIAESFQVYLGDILVFSTGASSIPPMGFDMDPTITFHSTSPLPLANTCANTLQLSLLADIQRNFCSGVCNAVGFGQV